MINDGSEDNTVQAALNAGAQHVISHTSKKGLATAYMSGLEKALRLGADIIVNTDADNQYRGSDIERLIQPILRGEADITIGSRPIQQIAHFSATKKMLHRVGGVMVRWISGTTVVDPTSGFRAISREAARQLFVYNQYTYTIETIIQAGQQNLKIVSIPIGTNKDLRRSRLIKSIPQYLTWSIPRHHKGRDNLPSYTRFRFAHDHHWLARGDTGGAVSHSVYDGAGEWLYSVSANWDRVDGGFFAVRCGRSSLPTSVP